MFGTRVSVNGYKIFILFGLNYPFKNLAYSKTEYPFYLVQRIFAVKPQPSITGL